jgi:endonuclease/exonuclease/phosphatase family metal-dependent hydrolase
VVTFGLFAVFSHSGLSKGGFNEENSEYTYTTGKWGFPSDHLPVVVDVQFLNRSIEKFVTFNVLNEEYKPYIQKGQGLTGSTLDKMTENRRIRLLLDVIQKLAQQGVTLFAFQEANLNFINALESSPLVSTGRFGQIIAQNFSKQEKKEAVQRNDYGVILYSKAKYHYSENASEIISYSLGEDSFNKYIQRVSLTHKSSNVPFFFVNSHVEFGKLNQIGSYLTQLKADHPNTPVIATGDFNAGFGEEVTWSVLNHLVPVIRDYSLVETPGFTHVSTTQELDRYDFFVYSDSKSRKSMNITVSEKSIEMMTVFQRQALEL